jgi:hypothetical protein
VRGTRKTPELAHQQRTKDIDRDIRFLESEEGPRLVAQWLGTRGGVHVAVREVIEPLRAHPVLAAFRPLVTLANHKRNLVSLITTGQVLASTGAAEAPPSGDDWRLAAADLTELILLVFQHLQLRGIKVDPALVTNWSAVFGLLFEEEVQWNASALEVAASLALIAPLQGSTPTLVQVPLGSMSPQSHAAAARVDRAYTGSKQARQLGPSVKRARKDDLASALKVDLAADPTLYEAFANDRRHRLGLFNQLMHSGRLPTASKYLAPADSLPDQATVRRAVSKALEATERELRPPD